MSTNLNKQLEDLQKRRADLKRDLAKATEGIDNRKRSLGADALAGRDNAAGLDALAREQLKISALQEGLAQADDQIAQLSVQIEQAERAAHQKIFDGELAETEEAIVEGLAKLYAFEASLVVIDEKFSELARAGMPYIPELQYCDPAKILMNVRDVLTRIFSDGNTPSFIRTLESESSYRPFVERARAKGQKV